MKNEVWYNGFMEALRERFPKKRQLAGALAELLQIEREAAYRRLRGDVAFSFSEIVKISSSWNISLDKIMGIGPDNEPITATVPFIMRPFNYIDPSFLEMGQLKFIIQSIDNLKNYPDGEVMEVCNKLPRRLVAGFESLNRFYLFKWFYQYGNRIETAPFSQIAISEEKLRLTADYWHAVKNIPQTNFIFDYLLFNCLISEIQYFHSIRMIAGEEKDHIKSDLHKLLDYLQEIASGGCYPETGNKVNLYISRLNINTNYSYTYANHLGVCVINAFDKYELQSDDPKMALTFRTWMKLKTRSSIYISMVDEKSKTDYFTEQRRLVNTL